MLNHHARERILTSEKNSRPLLCLQCPTQLIVLSSYWSVCTCYLDIAKSGALIQFIILCNVTAILIFFVVKLEEEARQYWLLKLIHRLIIVTLLILEHATGTKSSWVRAVWRLTSVTAETELTNGDSRNINNYKRKFNPPFLTWIIFYCFIKNVSVVFL